MVTPWNKGLTFEDDPRIPRPWLGKKRSKETIEKIRLGNFVEEMAFVCQFCGKTIFLKPYQTKKRKYCSRECAFKAIRTSITQSCQYCGKEYKVKKCLIGVSKYCSKLCHNKANAELKKRRAKVTLVCEGCGKEFTVRKGEVTARNPRYCSPECFHKYMLTDDVKARISNSVKQYYEEHPEFKDKLRELRLKQIIPSKDSSIEVALQKELDRRGIPYEKHLSVLGICQPDIVFSGRKIAVFADGDYWHKKDDDVVAKDQFQNKFLRDNDWAVLRFWGHEIREDVVGCVNQIVERVNP